MNSWDVSLTGCQTDLFLLVGDEDAPIAEDSVLHMAGNVITQINIGFDIVRILNEQSSLAMAIV